MSAQQINKVWVILDPEGKADFDGTIYFDSTEKRAIEKFSYPSLNWEAYAKDGYTCKFVNIIFLPKVFKPL